jgi:hypothetical protein
MIEILRDPNEYLVIEKKHIRGYTQYIGEELGLPKDLTTMTYVEDIIPEAEMLFTLQG